MIIPMHSHILIVDDQQDMRQLLRVFLETAGYRVSEAGDGIEALRLAKVASLDLILLDLNMPGPSGLSVLKTLKAGPDFKVPVMVLTAETDMDSALAGIAAGANAYMTKPVTRVQLLAKVTELVAHGSTEARKRGRKRGKANTGPITHAKGHPAPGSRRSALTR
jgi:DNA-binding response OmpR family regulator